MDLQGFTPLSPELIELLKKAMEEQALLRTGRSRNSSSLDDFSMDPIRLIPRPTQGTNFFNYGWKDFSPSPLMDYRNPTFSPAARYPTRTLDFPKDPLLPWNYNFAPAGRETGPYFNMPKLNQFKFPQFLPSDNQWLPGGSSMTEASSWGDRMPSLFGDWDW